MASVRISRLGGQLGGGRGGATSDIYYCFECERILTFVAISDSGILCPICSCAVLEEFETPPSSPTPLPSPPPPPPLPRSTPLSYPQSFFPTSDTDSDSDLSEPLRPPPLPPPLPPLYPLDTLLQSASLLPPPSPPSAVIDRRSAPNLFLSPPEDDDTTQYGHFDGELEASWPPPPPPPLPEHDVWDFLHPPTETEEEIPNQHLTSTIRLPQPPPPPPPPRSELSSWNYFFPRIAELELNSPNHQRASQLQPPPLPPPPPPPCLQPQPMEKLLDMRMTEKLLSEWECHQCAICIENFELNQMVKLMPCKHLYHSVCILPWLDLRKSCPVCRCMLPSQ